MMISPSSPADARMWSLAADSAPHTHVVAMTLKLHAKPAGRPFANLYVPRVTCWHNEESAVDRELNVCRDTKCDPPARRVCSLASPSVRSTTGNRVVVEPRHESPIKLGRGLTVAPPYVKWNPFLHALCCLSHRRRSKYHSTPRRVRLLWPSEPGRWLSNSSTAQFHIIPVPCLLSHVHVSDVQKPPSALRLLLRPVR